MTYQRIGRDPFHERNHHRKAGPMTSKTRPLTEQEAIDEQTEHMTATKVHSRLQDLVEELKATCKVRKEEWVDTILEGDVKKLRKRLFKQSSRIKELEADGCCLRASVRTLQQVIKNRQKVYDELLASSATLIADLREKGYYDKKGDTE